jgi:hypothetical protein
MPALPLFAQLRRFTLAVIAAAETAADYAGIAYTDAPAGGEADPVEPMDTIRLEKRSLLTMPGGWRMEQMRAEQPTTTYPQFVQAKLNEACRCLNMPYNIAAGNSSGYNYASGRLDHQTYYKALRVDQARLAAQVLDRIFAAWLRPASSPASCPPASMPPTGRTSGSGTGTNTSIRRRRPTPRPPGSPTTRPPWPTSTPARARTGRRSCASGRANKRSCATSAWN